MATFTGDEGTVSYGGAVVAEVLSFTWSGAQKGMIPTTAKGTLANTYRSGRYEGGSVAVTAMFDYADGAQGSWTDDVDVAAQTEVALVLLTATGKTATMQALGSGFEYTNPEGEGVATVTFTAKVTGVPTWAWV